MTADFARKLAHWNSSFKPEDAVLVEENLDSLNRKELKKLKAIIKNDIDRQAGDIIRPPLPVEYRIAGKLLNMIDDRLGTLDYNLVSEGRIARPQEPPATVSYYFFQPDCGPEFVLYIGASTIVPQNRNDDIFTQRIRVFVKAYRVTGGEIYRGVKKIELLEGAEYFPVQ